MACVIDTFREKGVPLTRQAKGMIGKQAKELLLDGFDLCTLTVAAVIALRRGEPQNMYFIANDLVMAKRASD